MTGREGTVTCRFTHVYPDGPCLYFTFGGMVDKAKDARAVHGGAVDLHRGNRRATAARPRTITPSAASTGPFYDKQRPELFARALRGAKRELDPKGMMKPGVLIDP